MIEYALVWVMGQILKGIEVICGVWRFIHEYETMKYRGYKLMTDENGEEFWVGYGD